MRKHRYLSIILILLTTSGVGFGQEAAPAKAGIASQTDQSNRLDQSSQSASEPGKVEPPNKFDQARFDALRAEGASALFNLDYEGARQRFHEIKRLFPEHPAGPLLLASSLWLQKLGQAGRLQASLYNSKSFYAKTDEQAETRTDDPIRELLRQAIILAKAQLKRNPRDPDALYFLGSAEGIKAAFEATVERSFIAALRDGSNSVDHHRQVLKLDPNYHDAELTVGLYDYVAGNLPLPFKLVASIAGVRGSKKRGLATIERVVKEGRWARDNARIVLITLYKREKRFDDALVLSRELSAQYPHNYLFKLETADALASLAGVEREKNNSAAAEKLEREAFETFDALLHDREVARSFDLVHYRFGEALLVADQPERAAREFLSVTAAANAGSDLVTMSHLRAAQALDLVGKRSEAVVQYQAVLNRPNAYDTHDEAKRGLREPFRKRDAPASNHSNP